MATTGKKRMIGKSRGPSATRVTIDAHDPDPNAFLPHSTHAVFDSAAPYAGPTRRALADNDRGAWSDVEVDVVGSDPVAGDDFVVGLRQGDVRARLHDLTLSKAQWEATDERTRRFAVDVLHSVFEVERALRTLLQDRDAHVHEAARKLLVGFLDVVRAGRSNYSAQARHHGNAAMFTRVLLEEMAGLLSPMKDQYRRILRSKNRVEAAWLIANADALNDALELAPGLGLARIVTAAADENAIGEGDASSLGNVSLRDLLTMAPTDAALHAMEVAGLRFAREISRKPRNPPKKTRKPLKSPRS